MINELLKKINNSDDTTLKTDSLMIKNNAFIMENTSIQINNVSMISRNNFDSPITLQQIFILLATVLVGFFFPLTFIATLLFGSYLYYQHQEHRKTKYFMTFNLGSNTNYYLYFDDKNFRDKVYQTITDAFIQNKNNIFIDLKNQNIQNQTVFEKGSTQNNINGEKNVVGNNIDNSLISTSGDVISDSNIIKDSQNSTQSIVDISKKDILWDKITEELNQVIGSQKHILSQETLEALEQLAKASQNEDKSSFLKTITNNKNIFDNKIVQDIFSNSLSGIIVAALSGQFK